MYYFLVPQICHVTSGGVNRVSDNWRQSARFLDKGVRRILVRGVNGPLPPEAKKILKI